MSYSPHNIRNICLLGHGGNGKTTLVESFLRMTGVIDRLGKTTDGNTVCDYDPEEIKRQIGMEPAVRTKRSKANFPKTAWKMRFPMCGA